MRKRPFILIPWLGFVLVLAALAGWAFLSACARSIIVWDC